MAPVTHATPLWQNMVAIAIAVAAAGWLIRRAFKPKPPEQAPCANCPAHLSTAKRPERTSSPISILKK
ncbi:MAG: hypothetical protein ACM3JJ_12295 [Hyphomicrobiales bacterium]